MAQCIRTLGGRIVGEPVKAVCQGVLDEGGRFVLRLANRQLDLAEGRRRRYAGKQVAQLFKRIGLQTI